MSVTKKLICTVVILLCTSFLLAGCLFPTMHYRGEHSELMAAALYSMPGTRTVREDELVVLGSDRYGRTIFAVLLTGSWMIKNSFEEGILGVFVVQGSDESASYIYSEKNYIFTIISKGVSLTDELVKEHFSEDDIVALKQKNDWDVAPEDTMIVPAAVPKTLKKDRKMEKETVEAIEASIGTNTRQLFFKEDDTGKVLYFICNIDGKYAEYEWYLAILDASGNLIDSEDAIIRLDDIKMEDIPNAIADYLQKNNWVHITEPQ